MKLFMKAQRDSCSKSSTPSNRASSSGRHRRSPAAAPPAARVRNLDEALNHAQVQSRQLLQDGKTNNGRSVPVAAFDYAEEGPSVRSSAPIFAAHTENIMLKLGYSLSDIKLLSQRGVVAVSE